MIETVKDSKSLRDNEHSTSNINCIDIKSFFDSALIFTSGTHRDIDD